MSRRPHTPGRFSLAVSMTAAVGVVAMTGCCPTTAGPTAAAASHTVTLAPGELRFFDVETPQSTTQINLTFRIAAVDRPLQLRQIDPGCLPAAQDACGTFYDSVLAPRSPGVVQFGNTLQPRGPTTRIVVKNPSEEGEVTFSLTIQPYRAGCT